MAKEKIRKIKISEMIHPLDGIQCCHKDDWWVVTPAGEIMFYVPGGVNSPQCNANKNVAEMIQRKLYPECEVIQIPFIFIRVHPGEDFRTVLPKKENGNQNDKG